MRVSVLQNVFRGGEMKLRKGEELELDGDALATALRRGYVEKAAPKAESEGKGKGKKSE